MTAPSLTRTTVTPRSAGRGWSIPIGSSRHGSAVLALGLLAALIGLPLGLVLLESFRTEDGLSVARLPAILAESGNVRVVANTVVLSLAVVAVSTLIAAPLAHLMARTTMGRHRWLDVALMVPFMTPPFIASMGWILFMQRRGFLEQALPASAWLQPWFFSFLGMTLVMAFNLYPFLYLLLRNAIENVGDGVDEAAAVHGAGAWYRLRRVIAPLLASSYSIGALLVFVKAASEFGTPITLGRRIGFPVLTAEIHRNTSQFPIDFTTAAALSSVLLGIGVSAWFLQQWFTARRNDRVVGGRGQRHVLRPLGRWRAGAWAYVVLVLGLSIGVPFFSVASSAITRLQGPGLTVDNLSLDHFRTVFTWGSPALTALATSARLAVAAATVVAVLGLALGVQIVRGSSPLRRPVDALALAPDMMPAIVLVVGLILMWNSTWIPFTIYNTGGMLVLAYVVLYLPFGVQSVKAVLGQMGDSIFEAASVSGASPWYRLRRVTLPLVLPAVAAGWIMTFIISMRELVGSLILRPPGMDTMSTFIVGEFEQGNRSVGMVLALVGVLITVSVAVATDRFRHRLVERRSGSGS